MSETNVKTNPCSGCGGPVPARRRSVSGDHYCKDSGCQALKQRRYRATRRAARLGEPADVDQARFDFFVAVLGRRVRCSSCDLEDAIPGYVHRGKDGTPCFGVGSGGAGIGGRWLDSVHPGRVPG